ncbi:MAG: GMC family oxidoreductase [Deltaproteobacteria bacterium]|nr:GMC family oxidoreductase [Deltaproteobacteria bacterium]
MKTFAGQTVDVVVVGSGAGGGTFAYGAARAGKSVVLLEKGPWYRDEDYVHDEIASVRRDMWVPYPTEDPHVLVKEGGKPQKSPEGWIARCVGGGTVHMSGFFYRHHPEDFRLARRYPDLPGAELADWPITYEALAPFYDEVEKIIGVSGKAGQHPFEPPRAGDYPLEPLADSNLAEVLDRGIARLGLHGFATPRAVLSRPYRGRSPCVYCAFCGSFGCEVGAKSSAASTMVPLALATGRCELRAGSMVFEIVTDASGRATGVRYFDEEGTIVEQKARVVVVGATAVESARLLLASRSKAHPEGIGNAEGQVGRHLHFSALGKAWAELERAALPAQLREDDGMPFLGRSVQDTYFLKQHAGGYDKGGTLNFIGPHRNPIYTAERLSWRGRPGLWGAKLKAALHRYYHEVRELELEVFAEFLPNPKTFVSLDPEVKDRWGLPAARIDVSVHPLSRARVTEVTKIGIEVFRAAGAAAAEIETAGGFTGFLQGGTCRMGSDPKESVVDARCRVHGVPNLLVVDGGALPTSGGVPNTFTIMANALRASTLLGKG